jgi:general secretion pathway protein M
MIMTLSPRERRLIAVALLLMALVIVYYGVISPIVGGFADRAAQREALTASFARDERVIDQMPRLRRQAEAQRSQSGRFEIAAIGEAAANERLGYALSSAVTAVGGELRGIEFVAAAPKSARARLAARLTLPQLVRLLANIQNQPPLLVVESLTVAADEAAQTGHLGLMDVTVELSANIATPSSR